MAQPALQYSNYAFNQEIIALQDGIVIKVVVKYIDNVPD